MRRLPEIGQDFFDYLESSAGQRVVTRAGYVPSAPTIYAFDAVWSRITNALLQAETPEQFEALQNAVRVLKPRDLFGGAFRFEADSETLDASSLALLRQLVRLIEYGELDGRQLMFAGFGAEGAHAQMVEQALFEALQPLSLSAETVSIEFGDIIPLECPETEGAERLNTRVEVWIR
jgi:phosphate transport system substrate-binding protein